MDLIKLTSKKPKKNYTFYEAINLFLTKYDYKMTKENLNIFYSFFEIYLDNTYDMFKAEKDYAPLTNRFINKDVAINKVRKVIHEVSWTLIKKSLLNRETNILFQCIQSLPHEKKKITFFWELLNIFSHLNDKESATYSTLKMLWLDFCLNIASRTRNDMWEETEIKKWETELLDPKLKKQFNSKIKHELFIFHVSHKKTWGTLIDIAYKNKTILKKISDLRKNNYPVFFDEKIFNKVLQIIYEKLGIIIDDNQKEVIKSCLQGVTFVNGKAGTGKTLIISCVALYYFLLNQPELRCIILSFTGKAVSVLNEKLLDLGIKNQNIEARTFHRELAKIFEAPTKMPTFYLVDESTMISTTLIYELLENAEIRNLALFGDKNQLPPIQPGTPFISLLNVKNYSSHCQLLKQSFREDKKEKHLINFKNSILTNELTKIQVVKNHGNKTGIMNLVIKKVENDCKDLAELHFQNHYKELKEIIVTDQENWETKLLSLKSKRICLAPTNKTVNQLNFDIHKKLLAKQINTVLLPITQYNREYKDEWGEGLPVCVGTKMIFNGKNKYVNKQLYLANGETCIISEVKKIKTSAYIKCKIKVIFSKMKQQTYIWHYTKNKQTVKFFKKKNDINFLSNFRLAYALTIHKSQGSEYNQVVSIFTNANAWQLNNSENKKGASFYSKNMLYTAISRAKVSSYLIVPDNDFLIQCMKIDATETNSYMAYLVHKENNHAENI